MRDFWASAAASPCGATFTPYGRRTGAPIGAGCRSSLLLASLRRTRWSGRSALRRLCRLGLALRATAAHR